MSTLSLFLLAAGGLALAALALLLWPFWHSAKTVNAVDRAKSNLEVLRDQLRELEADRDDGLIAPADFAQAKDELQRRLLEEARVSESSSLPAEPVRRRTAVVLAILLPLTAVCLYLQLGNLRGLDSVSAKAHGQSDELNAMLVRLTERLKANPDDAKGWVMLARSYKAIERFDEAAEAYARGHAVVEGDAYLLADYAETLMQANGGVFTEKADALVARALKLDPNSMLALFLAGNSANDRRDFAAAITYWERLLPQLEGGSEDALAVEAAIEKARADWVAQGGAPRAKKAGPVSSSSVLEGEVLLSGKLASRAHPEDPVYVFARAPEGSRMPLVVMRARVADLPMKFRLDEGNRLPGGEKLSSLRTVVLEARIAQKGLAHPTSGDLFGTLREVRPGTRGHRLVVDQVQP